jgi:hypothetical protein
MFMPLTAAAGTGYAPSSSPDLGRFQEQVLYGFTAHLLEYPPALLSR